MADQYVSKIGNLFIVSVCYLGELHELRSASFGAPTGVLAIVWNLMTVGRGAPARFNAQPLECPPAGSCSLRDIRRISDTQCTAVLEGDTRALQAMPYLIRVDTGKTTLVHDPTIVVSPDPVEIP